MIPNTPPKTFTALVPEDERPRDESRGPSVKRMLDLYEHATPQQGEAWRLPSSASSTVSSAHLSNKEARCGLHSARVPLRLPDHHSHDRRSQGSHPRLIDVVTRCGGNRRR